MRLITPAEIRRLLKQDTLHADDRLSILKTVSCRINEADGEYDPITQELLLRLLDKRSEFLEYNEILDSLVIQAGLFPYLSNYRLSWQDAISMELHRPTTFYDNKFSDLDRRRNSDSSFVFHRVQAQVFAHLMNGENLILSAPTSFGKSAVIDALIDSTKYENIVIIVPTIALIDETRRRLSRFRQFKIITHASQQPSHRNVYLVTQERVLAFPSLPNPDLLIIDEFYKLSPNGDDERAIALNIAFYSLAKRAKQFYLLGPNIHSIPEGFPERFSCRFIRTDFATVVTEVIRIRSSKLDEEAQLLRLCKNLSEPTLIYCASPARAGKLANALLDGGLGEKTEALADAAQWIGQHYHPDWTLVKALDAGIAMHHGKMPRAIAQVIVKAFNEGHVKYLICTSTLIEGVNTKAKNVIVFDNKIAKSKLDYFTFCNIRGRSGRMFEHFVGRVYLFHEEPQDDLPFVDIPAFTQDELNAPEALLLQLEPSDLTPNSTQRLEALERQSILPPAVLRESIGIDPRRLIKLARFLQSEPQLIHELAWDGFPKYSQLKTLCELIWSFLVDAGRIAGISSGKQLAFRLNQLKFNSIPQIIFADSQDVGADAAVEGVLDFIRQWPQFRFGKLAIAVASVRNAVALSMGATGRANFSSYVVQVESLFTDPALIALDEYGVPLPLAQKLKGYIKTNSNLDLTLESLKGLKVEKLALSKFEHEMLSSTIESLR